MPKISSENLVQGRQKRKISSVQKLDAKRAKQNSETENDYQKRFKFVLAPKNRPEIDTSTDDETFKIPPKLKKKLKPKEKKSLKNGNDSNGTSKTLAAYENNMSESDDTDDSYLCADMESLSEEESCDEEWSTDTDFSEHSFHESDCESVESDHQEETPYDSSDDDDYVPSIEDIYVKKGEAIMHDAKGLDLAFGNSSESQIIDLMDVSAEIVESDDEVPELLPINGLDHQNEFEPEHSSKIINSAEDTLKNLSLSDNDDEIVESSQLLQRASFFNCIDNRGVIVRINRTIHFHGILVIKPIVNKIQVNGFTLQTNQSLKITSISRTDYFLNLTPIIDKNGNIDRNEVHEELKKLLQTESDADEIVRNLNPDKDVILHLQQGLPDAKVEMLQTYLSDPVLPHKNMILRNSVCPSSELILATKFFVQDENPRLNAYRINADWDYVEIKPDIKLMVIGGKNVGKSALTQYLINKNLSKYPKMLLIDLDIGQPICAASQTISASLITQPLIGPGYLNNTKVEKSFLFGDKSVMVSPFKYNECVAKLIDFCNGNEELKGIPWIINTMGYQKGFGLQLMCLLLRIIQPTDVVQIQHSNFRYNFKYILKEDLVNNFIFSFFNDSYLQRFQSKAHFTTHVLDSIVNSSVQSDDDREWTSNATEKRKLSILAQLSALMKGGQTYLNDVVPFGTSIENIRLIVIDEDYPTQHDLYNGTNLDLFNGNLVYLCHGADNNETLDSNSILECFGIGIVRAIDKVHNYIYILLPQHDNSEKLKAMVNVLAIGNIPMPAEVLVKQNFGVNGTVPFVTFFKDRNMSQKKYINKRNIKDCF